MDRAVKPSFIDKLEQLCSVPESVFSKPDLLNLYTDTLRSLLSKLLSPQSISRVALTFDSLKTAFKKLKQEVEQKRRLENKIFGLDTSELLSSSSPTYNWYYCLRSVFSNPKSLDFIVPPWFLIEIIETLIRRVQKRPHSNYESKVLSEISKQKYIARYFDQFNIDWQENYVHLKPNEWEQPDLGLKCIESLRSICKDNRSVYVAIRLNRLFKAGVIHPPESKNLLESFSQYGEFSESVNNNNERYLDFREELFASRKHSIYSYQKSPGQVEYNSSIDSIAVGFLDWALKSSKTLDKQLLLLSRDSLYETVNNWFENNKFTLSCYNPQILYLQWMLIDAPFEVKDILYICDKAIDDLEQISDILTQVVVSGKSHKLEAVQKIIYWFSKKRILKNIEYDIVRAGRVLARSQGVEENNINVQGYVRSLLSQADELDDKVKQYLKVSELIVDSVERLESEIGHEVIPLFDEADKWAKQLKVTTKGYAKLKAASP